MTPKRVLLVDNVPDICELLERAFGAYSASADAVYQFQVTKAFSREQCVQILSKTADFDVIVFDKRLHDDGDRRDEDGLALALSFSIPPGEDVTRPPVRIMFTAHAHFDECVRVIRAGVWDYIRKSRDPGSGRTPFQEVVDSAVTRLRQLDTRDERDRVATAWVTTRMPELMAEHAGRLVALWHLPSVSLVASGKDTLDLAEALEKWRRAHQPWEDPLIVRIPARDTEEEV